MRALEKLQEISGKLSPYNIEDSAAEAEVMLRHGLDIDLVEIYRDNPEINNEQTALIEKMIDRRTGREPLQYIIGHTDFLGLKISVGQGVLIPRPETELMAEIAIKAISDQQSVGATLGIESRNRVVPTYRLHGDPLRAISRQLSTVNCQPSNILDLCTGSGCLALALAKNFPDSQVYGIDISGAAIGYAGKNAENNGTMNVKFLKGDLFAPLEQDSAFDFIISNPPYIRKVDIKDLQPEIRDWEPLNALDGGESGLDYYRKIIPAAREHLRKNGILMFEAGFDGADEVADLFEQMGYSHIQITEDYSGIKRVVSAQWTR